MMKRDLKALTLNGLAEYLTSINYPKYHAQQIFLWLYQRGISDFSLMSDLPSKLRQQLQKEFYLSELALKEKLASTDGTRKYLFELEDKNIIESVFIPHFERNTICLSTQVGCKFSCKFCASGMLGFVRNLSQDEILNQILAIRKDLRENINTVRSKTPKAFAEPSVRTSNGVNNIVFMGIGEPLDNYENTLNSLRIINAKFGFNIGQRKITISTCGLVEGIKKLSKEGLQVELSVSLHSADNQKRSRLMPINKKYPLEKLIPALCEFAKLTKRKITFEYILLGKFNTAKDDAKKLTALTKKLDCKVNLIPFNPVENSVFLAPSKLEALFFRDYLLKNNVEVTIRQPRGKDIEAACGQLRLRNLK